MSKEEGSGSVLSSHVWRACFLSIPPGHILGNCTECMGSFAIQVMLPYEYSGQGPGEVLLG